jgi:hypothetical protein
MTRSGSVAIRPVVFAFAAAVVGLVSAGRAEGPSSFEKTIPIPRRGDVRLGWSSGGCAVRSLDLRNYPDADDVRKARETDHDDKSWLWWDFHVENRSSNKCKIALFVDVYDRSGNVVKSSDKSDSVDEHKMDDNIRVSTRMRTIDIADSPRARIRAEITSR